MPMTSEVPFDVAIEFLEEYYPDELNVLGPSEVEHILAGGTYGETKGALHSDPFPALNNLCTILTLLQFVCAAVKAGLALYKKHSEDTVSELTAENLRVIDVVRTETIQSLLRDRGIAIEATDSRVSADAIARAIIFLEGRSQS